MTQDEAQQQIEQLYQDFERKLEGHRQRVRAILENAARRAQFRERGANPTVE